MANKTKKYRQIPLSGHNKPKYCVDIEGGNCCENARIIGYPCHKKDIIKSFITIKQPNS
jgi:hypothetical protein